MSALRDADVLALTEAGLLQQALPPSIAASSPWPIKLLLGAAAWFAAIFVLVFLVLLLEPDSPAEAGLIGALLIGASFALFLVRPTIFLEQVALAAALAGQGFLLYALGEWFDSSQPSRIAFLAAALQVVCFALLPNAISRSLSAFFAAVAWASAWRLLAYESPDSGTMGIGGWLLVFLPLLGLLAFLLATERRWWTRRLAPHAQAAAGSLITAICVAPLIFQPFQDIVDWRYGQTTLALWPLLSVLVALVALAAARQLQSAALMALAIVSAIANTIAFYYMLGVSLLFKSLLLLALAGLAFALARMLHVRRSAP
jgi:hypothetical protein